MPNLYHICQLFRYLSRQLSDIDNDGKMTLQEFTIAVHLVQAKCRGVEIPKVLPYSLKSSSVQSQSVFGGTSNTPVLNPMNNGAIGTPMMSSMGMQPGGMLTPMSLGSGPSMSTSFASSGQFSSSMGFGSGMSGNNPPGFHTGMSGSSTFPRNMHLSQTSTPYGSGMSSGMSSLDSLGLMTTSAWSQTNQKSTVNRAASLGPTQGASSLGPSPGAGQFPASSLAPLGGLQFGANAPAATSPDNSAFGSKPSTGQVTPSNRLKYTQMFKAADHEKNGYIRGNLSRLISML